MEELTVLKIRLDDIDNRLRVIGKKIKEIEGKIALIEVSREQRVEENNV